MATLLVFIMATLEIVFGRKKNYRTEKVHLAVKFSKIRLVICMGSYSSRTEFNKDCFTSDNSSDLLHIHVYPSEYRRVRKGLSSLSSSQSLLYLHHRQPTVTNCFAPSQ